MANFLNDPYAGYPVVSPYNQKPVTTDERANHSSGGPGLGSDVHVTRGRAAVAPADVHASQLDAQARAAGYPSYEAMINFLRLRSQHRAPQTVDGGGHAATPGTTPGSLMPGGILGYVAEKFRQATGG